MKTPQEFRIEVYEKRDAKLAARKKARRLTTLCVPLALVVLLGGVFAPRLLGGDGHIAKKANIPLALQAGKPAKVKQITSDNARALWEEYLSENSMTENEITESDYDEVHSRYSALEAENQLISPDFHTALNSFARDSAVLLADDFEENACYSPLSLYYALALAGSGAAGKTEQEFLEVLHAPDMDWLSDQCGRYYRQHYSDSERYQFLLANSIWMDGSRSFEQDFLDGAENDFYASLFRANFTDPALGDEMTKWVSDNTNGLLAPEFEFDPNTVMDILNTVYFYAEWSEPFYEEANTQGDFHKADGAAVTAEFMRAISTGSVFQGNGFTRASLPLSVSGSDGEMIFILPDEGVAPQELLSSPEAFEKMFFPGDPEEYVNCRVKWRVPKFNFDCEYNLADMLKAQGLSTAFSSDTADFSGMSREIAEQQGLYISNVRQGTHIGVDEKGVEVAAYTEIMQAAGFGLLPDEIVEMNLDRPFLFAIAKTSRTDQWNDEEDDYEESGGSLLFVGICGDPTR